MFDTVKVQRMTVELEQFAREHPEIYVIPEWLSPEAFALFKRMLITVRAIVVNAPPAQKEIFGCPVILMSEAIRSFTPQTGIIHLSAKPQPAPVNMATFTIGNQQLNVPLFAVSADEVLAIYDRLTLMKVLQQYQEDGLPPSAPQVLATRFARGLTTFLDPTYQNFKYQFWDRREYFNPRYDFDDTAIVIQEPIAYANNYTAETFKLYRLIYPNVPIVVSTWQDEATDAFRAECKKYSVALLENDPPTNLGPGNLNMQLESSFQGVKYVQENTSAKFVLKTRTDQRIYRPDFLTYFKNLILTFPPLGNKLQGRILLLEGSKWLPFRTSDFLSFGYIADIFKLYDIPQHAGQNDELLYRYNHPARMGFVANITSIHHMQNCIPNKNDKKFRKFNRITSHLAETEAYILRNFYSKYIASIDKRKIIETSWKFMQEYLLILGIPAISLDWYKYEQPSSYDINGTAHLKEIAFSRWLDMYRNFKIDWV